MLTALSLSPLDHARGDPECVEGSKGMVEGPQGERENKSMAPGKENLIGGLADSAL